MSFGDTENGWMPLDVVKKWCCANATLGLYEIFKFTYVSAPKIHVYRGINPMIGDDWSDSDEDGIGTIETVTCFPPDNIGDVSDNEVLDDDIIGTNIFCDDSPLNEDADMFILLFLFIV